MSAGQRIRAAVGPGNPELAEALRALERIATAGGPRGWHSRGLQAVAAGALKRIEAIALERHARALDAIRPDPSPEALRALGRIAIAQPRPVSRSGAARGLYPSCEVEALQRIARAALAALGREPDCRPCGTGSGLCPPCALRCRGEAGN